MSGLKRVLPSLMIVMAVSLSSYLVPAEGQSLPTSKSTNKDPIALYVEAGADKEQQSKIRDLVKQYEEGANVKAKDAMALFKKMKSLSLEPDLNETEIMLTQDQINKVQAEMATDRNRLLMRIRKTLTPEQRIKLVSLMQSKSQAMRAQPLTK
jgi:Spy/CpxP family protein refolding chaperone